VGVIILKIEWREGDQERAAYATDEAPITIGRNPECDVVLDNPHVSRRHAAIFYRRGAFHLHNVSDTNPIVYNKRWEIGHNKNVPIQPGDTFELGGAIFSAYVSHTFEFAEEPAAPIKYRCAACGNLLDQPEKSCYWCGETLDGPDALTMVRQPGE
jgi:predicted component of type VI protein secretion system